MENLENVIKLKGLSMIYMFRKEMKKWHTVLWFVFAAMALGSGFGLFYKRRGPEEAIVGRVDGQGITFKAYKKTLKNIIAPYVQLYGMSEDKVMSLLSQMGNIDEMAFNMCVEEKLVDRVQKSFDIKIDNDTFNGRLVEMMPPTIIGQDGKVNMEMYQQYMKMLSTTPADFEKHKEGEFKRELAMRFIANSSYISAKEVQAEIAKQNSKKSFEILAIPQKYFLNDAKKSAPDDKELESFFNKDKEKYRVADKAKAKYWEIGVDEYEKKIELDEQSIKNFYDKNKAQLYRIAPKVKVRKILIKSGKVKDGFKLAQDVHQKVKQSPAQFAALAKQYSDDKLTAQSGGLVDFFSRGKYDPDFEKAAFKLKDLGEISDIITTKDGFEMVQLVERMKAVEKPFESVKNEIAATLKNKRAIATLQGELGTLMHDVRSENESIEKFAAEKGLAEKETGWISEKEAAGSDVVGQLAQKVLGSGRESNYGYLKTSGKYVIYKLLQKEKSYLPELKLVKNTVIEDYYNYQADLMAKKNIAKIKADILCGTATLKQGAGKIGILQTNTTGLIKNGDPVAGLEKDLPLLKKMFVLDDKSQVLQDNNGGTYYLVQLIEEQAGAVKDTQNLHSIINKEKYNASRKQVSAFIASLQRNAKIDMDKKVLSGHKNNYTKED
ncbi:MAG: PpiC-type peptidyl-prolyl cis-trans isomerase [candidate division TM6 bacterium GW2011_GWF2_37_49]|nr:MAG: PpiC-type peptidyl-prolyl cis-trans isomerase [candidate division TM6 bacterium GW2011_GWF2_37_49]